MASDPQVSILLEEIADTGRTPEEVCQHCPELLREVREGWRRLRACDAQLDALFPDATSACATPMSHGELPRIAGYEIEQVLGRGGMGVVLRARHLRLGRVVAVKMMLAGVYAGPQERERFQREARAVAALQHPNIVQVYDVGDHEGQPYFTMELLEQGSLAQALGGAPQCASDAARLLAHLASAIEAAHRGGIVHRDLKPANILLAADGVAKISDFGLARRLDGETALTRSGDAMGTPSYMAPEQARPGDDAVGPATDIYALGAILYELLTGRPPFRAETAAETIQQVLSREPAPPTRLNASVPRDLETICMKCLHKEPRRRYASSAALAEDLGRFLRGEAIAARPERRWQRVVRRVRRRPLQSIAIGAGTLLMIGVVAGGAWLVTDRAIATGTVDAEHAAAERSAKGDLDEMVKALKKSAWVEAGAALERARGRLGERGAPELRALIEQGDRDLKLAANLETIRLEIAGSMPATFPVNNVGSRYEDTFREAGLGQVGDDPAIVAPRLRASNIDKALIAAMDHWSSLEGTSRRLWILNVSRKADAEATAWRDSARDPAVRADEAALVKLIQSAPVAEESVSLMLALNRQLKLDSKERLPFLTRIQQAHPGDFWANLTLADVLKSQDRPAESIRFYQAAVAIKPKLALGYYGLGWSLMFAGRLDDAALQLERAVEVEPTSVSSYQLLALILARLDRYDEALKHLERANRQNPGNANLSLAVGYALQKKGRLAEALPHFHRAIAIEPNNHNLRRELRVHLIKLGRMDDARRDWKLTIDADPPQHDVWSGYAEFCAFLGQDDEYLRIRTSLLAKFGDTTSSFVADRIARACLLLPASTDELAKVTALAQRGDGNARHPEPAPHTQFNQGLAEYRAGKFAASITTLPRTSKVLGPAPGLVLAMALHKDGRLPEARRTLAAANSAYDWRPSQVYESYGWIYHVLRREAEDMILPDLPAYLEGKHAPQDNDERLALVGICQATNRPLALVGLFSDAFRADPKLVEDLDAAHRFNATLAAILTSDGRGDASGLTREERTQWRNQAHEWLKADIAAWSLKWKAATPEDRILIQAKLAARQMDSDVAIVREPAALAGLSVGERIAWLALWNQLKSLAN